ncbi:MAG: 3-isopropylmalate dehydratase small subunit, partial [Candidatus Binatia bacterium]
NCTMMGVPTVTVGAKEMDQLMKSVEEDPRTEYAVDLEAKTLTCGGQTITVDLPETYRSALTSGCWDSTALLRANLDQVKKTAAKLPYIGNFPN